MDEEKFIDALSGNRVYVPSITAINKIDIYENVQDIKKDERTVLVSAKTGFGVDELRKKIFESLSLVRIYMKPEGGDADMEHPLVSEKGRK